MLKAHCSYVLAQRQNFVLREKNVNSAAINLDKLRNIVQKFGCHSFTTSQVASDYLQGDSASVLESYQFEDLLKRHAALLGIRPLPSSAAGDTIWVSAM
jgi:hypothetical protein